MEIERDAKRVRINIHCAKPGMVIGKQGAEIEKLRALCAKKLGKELNEVYINIVEIKQPDLNATLVAQNVAGQLERRVSFRRAVKGAIRNTMHTKRVRSRCRPSVQTLTTVWLRLRPLTAVSA